MKLSTYTIIVILLFTGCARKQQTINTNKTGTQASPSPSPAAESRRSGTGGNDIPVAEEKGEVTPSPSPNISNPKLPVQVKVNGVQLGVDWDGKSDVLNNSQLIPK